MSLYFGSIDYGTILAALRFICLFTNLFKDLSLEKPTYRERAPSDVPV